MQELVSLIRQDAVGVLPTDTLYGIVGRALSKGVVSRIYDIKGRDEHKPFIVLIGSLTDLKKFGVVLSSAQKRNLKTIWPGPVSVILPCASKKFEYLHRGTKSIAFRLPDDVFLAQLLKQTGPLVAPSANPQGKTPAATNDEAQVYFGSKVDFYVSGKKKKGKPSTIVDYTSQIPRIVRQGARNIKFAD